MILNVLVILIAFLLTVGLTPLVIRLGLRYNLVDAPNVRKVHSLPVPRIGGIAVFAPILLLAVSAFFGSRFLGLAQGGFNSLILKLLVIASFVFAVGLVDDIKSLRARFKLLCQLLAAVLVCTAGIRMTSLSFGDLVTIPLGGFSWVFTISWIVGVTNAVNLIDGLDGLAAGVCAMAAGAVFVIACNFADPFVALLMAAMIGALLGFLIYNFHPAKIFLGDSGSFMLGFVIASSSAYCVARTGKAVALAVPIVALGIPILDTLFTMLRRFLDRRSLFAPDSGHFHHRLLALGLNQRQAVVAVYLVTFCATGLGMFMLITTGVRTVVVFLCVLILLVMVFRVTGSVRLREIVQNLQKKYIVGKQVKEEFDSFQQTQLYFCRAETFDQWWGAICRAAENMGFATVALPLTNRDGTRRLLTWDGPHQGSEHDMVRMTFPVRDRRVGPPLKLRLTVAANGSLESTGRRTALFARLIDQYSLASLPRRSFSRRWTAPAQVCEVVQSK